MHSPWGVLQQVIKETGWTWHCILWRISWANIMLMMADRPGFKKAGEQVTKVSKEEIAERRRQYNHGR